MMILNWEKMNGLIPAIVQDARTLQVLMVGYMNRQALEQTQATKKAMFYSRSKGRLWEKGETSGNSLRVCDIQADCDGDALLILAESVGPTCHNGTVSCFTDQDAPGIGFMGKLWRIIEDRFEKRPAGSYTTQLFSAGLDRIIQKVGEETIEVLIATKNEDDDAFLGEVSDLLYHLMLLLKERGLSFERVVSVLRSRH